MKSLLVSLGKLLSKPLAAANESQRAEIAELDDELDLVDGLLIREQQAHQLTSDKLELAIDTLITCSHIFEDTHDRANVKFLDEIFLRIKTMKSRWRR